MFVIVLTTANRTNRHVFGPPVEPNSLSATQICARPRTYHPPTYLSLIMKFTVLTPALLAALAASASAAEYSTDAVSCTNMHSKIVCDAIFTEAECDAESVCAWVNTDDDTGCFLAAADQAVLEADEEKADAVLYDCGQFAEDETACAADEMCVWAGDMHGCVNEGATASAAAALDSAPKGIQAQLLIEGYQAEKCFSAANEAACTDEHCEYVTVTMDGQTQSQCMMNKMYKAAYASELCGTEGGDWSALASSGHKSAGAIALTFATLASAFALM